MRGSGRLGPVDLHFAVLRKAVAQVQIDQALVGRARLVSHAFEVAHHILRQPHGDWLFELGGIRVLARLQGRKVVFSFHGLDDRINLVQ